MAKKNKESHVNPQAIRAIVLSNHNLKATADVINAGLTIMHKFGAHTQEIDAEKVVRDFGNSIGTPQKTGPVWPLLTTLGRRYIQRWDELLQLVPSPEDSHSQFTTLATSLLGQKWLDFPDVTGSTWQKITQLARTLQLDWVSRTVADSKLAKPIIAEGVHALGLLSASYDNLQSSAANQKHIDQTSATILGTVNNLASQRQKAKERLNRTPRFKPDFMPQTASLTSESPDALFNSIANHLRGYSAAQTALRDNTTEVNTATQEFGYSAVASGLHSQTVLPASGELYDADLTGYLHNRLKIILGIGAASGLLIPTITTIAKLEIAVDRQKMAAAYSAYTSAIEAQKQTYADIARQAESSTITLTPRDVE